MLALTALAAAVLIAFACAVVWGLGTLLDVLSPVLWPLALAGVLACLMSPLVDWLEKRNVPRQRGIILVFVVVCGVVAAVLASVIPQLVEETQELVAKVPEYSTRLQQRIARLIAQPVRIGIAAQQSHLKEKHATGPHRRRPAKPRQDELGDQRLHLEEKECAK